MLQVVIDLARAQGAAPAAGSAQTAPKSPIIQWFGGLFAAICGCSLSLAGMGQRAKLQPLPPGEADLPQLGQPGAIRVNWGGRWVPPSHSHFGAVWGLLHLPVAVGQCWGSGSSSGCQLPGEGSALFTVGATATRFGVQQVPGGAGTPAPHRGNRAAAPGKRLGTETKCWIPLLRHLLVFLPTEPGAEAPLSVPRVARFAPPPGRGRRQGSGAACARACSWLPSQ